MSVVSLHQNRIVLNNFQTQLYDQYLLRVSARLSSLYILTFLRRINNHSTINPSLPRDPRQGAIISFLGCYVIIGNGILMEYRMVFQIKQDHLTVLNPSLQSIDVVSCNGFSCFSTI